jgi:AraC family transcriptional regulator
MEHLEPPRFDEMGPLLIAGLRASYTDATSGSIPALWQRFDPYLGHLPGQVSRVTYGLCLPSGEPSRFDYLCGVEVSDASCLPADIQPFTLGKQKYAVFAHRGYLATLRSTWDHIWKQWVPNSGLRIGKGARIEKYSETFCNTKPGGLEIWIPLD